jgi:serine/threonine-protein kinase
MEAVIMKALSKNPGDRYYSANAMLDDLELESLPRPSGKSGATRPARRKARGAGLVLASAVALMLVLGGGGALASGMINPPRSGDVASALSRMNPVESRPPAPPQQANAGSQGDESGSQNVAAVTEATTPQGDTQARKMVTVPDVTAYYDYYAADALARRGFKVTYVRGYHEGYAPRGVTWATDPAAGTLAPEGSTVTIYATPKDIPLPPRLR